MGHSVLIAEDEQNIVEALSFLMERAGLEVIVSRDGPRTIETARERKPDLLLLDIMLPGCDGFEVLEALRGDDGFGMRVLMLTAKGREIDRRKAFEYGVDDFVTKPFSNQDVVRRVNTLIREPKPGRPVVTAG